MDNSTNRLAWGLQPPEGTLTAWGARAIFERGHIDLVWDRTDIIGSAKDRTKLTRWINETGFPKITKIANRDLSPDSPESVEYSSKGFIIKACPRKSFGYIYLVAYPLNSD